MITIIDYGLGNLASIKNMLKKISVDSVITDKYDEIKKANKLILPGVGSFDKGMKNLNERGLVTLIKERVSSEVPLLGICLGMQLLTTRSEEGSLPGLNLIEADTKKFAFDTNSQMKVPHMAWSDVEINTPSHTLFNNITEIPRYYFVHSYYVECKNNEHSLGKTLYGKKFDSIIGKNNILGVQFHPEKSHKFGMQILKNFSEI